MRADLDQRVAAVLQQQREMASRLEGENPVERHAQAAWEAAIDRSLSGGAGVARPAPPAAPLQPRRELLMRVRVDLGAGRTETILFHRGDDVREVALAFVGAHGLGDRYAPIVAQHIERNLVALAASSPPQRAAPPSRRSTSQSQSSSKRRGASRSRFSGSTAPTPVPASFGDGGANDGGGDADEGEEAKYARLRAEARAFSSASRRSGRPRTSGRSTSRRSASRPATRRRVKAHANARRIEELASPVKKKDMDEVAAAERATKRAGGGGGGGKPGPVFNRLFEEAKHQQEKLERLQREHRATEERGISRPDMSPEKSMQRVRQGRLATDRFYQEAVYQRERLEKRTERHAAEIEKAELRDCTFHPHVNRPAGSDDDEEEEDEGVHSQTSIVDRLYVSGSAKKRIVQERAEKHDELEMEGCVFRPTIDPRSLAIAAKRRDRHHDSLDATDDAGAGSVHQKLYEESIQRRDHLEAIAEHFARIEARECPFVPDIGINRVHGHGGHVRGTSSSQDNNPDAVFERLHAEESLRREKLAQKIEEERRGEMVDPTSGRPLFEPSVGRGPAYERNPDALPVGDYLFDARHDFEDARERLLMEQEYEMKARLQNSFVSTKSLAIIERRQRKGAERIFNQLIDAHGVVHSVKLQSEPLLDARSAVSYGSARAARINTASFGAGLASRVDEVLQHLIDAKTVAYDDALAAKAAKEEQEQATADATNSAQVTMQGRRVKRSLTSKRRGSFFGYNPAIAQAQAKARLAAMSSSYSSSSSSTHAEDAPQSAADLERGFISRADFVDAAMHFGGLVPRFVSTAEPAPLPTFKPVINANSAKLAVKREHKRGGGDVPLHDHLYLDGAANAQRLENLRKESYSASISGCTFKPDLNPSKHRQVPDVWVQQTGEEDVEEEEQEKEKERGGGGGDDVVNEEAFEMAAALSSAKMKMKMKKKNRRKMKGSTSHRRGSFFGYSAAVAKARTLVAGAKAEPSDAWHQKLRGSPMLKRGLPPATLPATPAARARRPPQRVVLTKHPAALAVKSAAAGGGGGGGDIIKQLELATARLLKATQKV